MKFRLIKHVDNNLEYDNRGNKLTVEQSEYFKNSKVRNKQGKLIVCYRGAHSFYKNYKKNKTYSQGLYFSSNTKVASSYAYNDINPDKVELRESYLNIINPIIYNCKGSDWDRIPNPFCNMLDDVFYKCEYCEKYSNHDHSFLSDIKADFEVNMDNTNEINNYFIDKLKLPIDFFFKHGNLCRR